MAARIRKLKLTDSWREKIRVGMLLNHLRNHVLGRHEMTPTQVRAAEILLRKVLPDQATVEHSGEVQHTYVARMPEVANTIDQWQQQYLPNPLARGH